MEHNIIVACLSGIGIFIFAGISGFGYLHVFFWKFCNSNGQYIYAIFMI